MLPPLHRASSLRATDGPAPRLWHIINMKRCFAESPFRRRCLACTAMLHPPSTTNDHLTRHTTSAQQEGRTGGDGCYASTRSLRDTVLAALEVRVDAQAPSPRSLMFGNHHPV